MGLRGRSQRSQTWTAALRTTAAVTQWFITFAANKEGKFTEKVLLTWRHCTKKIRRNETRTHAHVRTPQCCRSAFSLRVVRWVIRRNLAAPANLSSSPPPSPPPPTCQRLIFSTYGWRYSDLHHPSGRMNAARKSLRGKHMARPPWWITLTHFLNQVTHVSKWLYWNYYLFLFPVSITNML